jgi:hypothetical protein
VMGANGGGEGRARLRYAASDASSFASVLAELGGVRGSDLILLMDPDLAAFRGAARRVQSAVASANASGQRSELILYYSGHSDDTGLLLGKERLPYSELRASIEGVPAAVRVAILDSCSSGSLTRSKGGAARPAFLFDSSSDMAGHAYITSSSAEEAAQESDRIGASFFTYHLISALRGAADPEGEGRVTLNEAYAYAFRETLSSTENTKYGPQHAAYEISLTGSGDLVLSDLRSAKAGLELAEALSGKLYLRDERGNLAVELEKVEGKRMEIGLAPGRYTAVLVDRDERSQAEFLVSEGRRGSLSPADFRGLKADPTVARGAEPSAAEPAAASLSASAAQPAASPAGFPVSLGMALLPDFSRGLYFSEEDKRVSLNILWGGARELRGAQFSTLLNADSGDMRGFQFAGLVNAVKGRAGGLQFAPIVNLASGGFGGAQVSGFNFSGGDSAGAQLGALNYAGGAHKGAQLGAVNIAGTVYGTQIGLVNIAERIHGFPVGLVNIESGGIYSPQLWSVKASMVRVGLAFGTRFAYTLASAGFDLSQGGQSPSVGLGVGARLVLGPFFGDLDVSWRELFGDEGSLDFSRPAARLEARALAGFPAKGPGLIAGCALEAFMPGLSRENDGSEIASFRVEPRFLFGFKL